MTAQYYSTEAAPANTPDRQLLVFGLGYTGSAIAQLARQGGWRVFATSRRPEMVAAPPGVALIAFDRAGEVLRTTTHLLQTAPPDEVGDPALHHYSSLMGEAPLRWAGLLSTTGVYGNRDGAWVDEDTPPAPTGPRGQRRFEAEQQWSAAFAHCAADLFRVGGIYGPGRSPFADVRAGRARRVDKPGHLFGRIHRDDIAGAVWAAMRQERGAGTRALNLTDDEPAANADVVAEAARLLGLQPPPLVPFETALRSMSPMGRSFWAESRRVASRMTQEALGYRWRYPNYREGLRAILEQERAEGVAE